MRDRPKRLAALGIAALLAVSIATAEAGPADRTSLVSRQSAAAGGNGADDDSFAPSVAGGGRFIAFGTSADNLGGPIDDGVGNVYVYDRRRGRVALVSRQSRSDGGQGGTAEFFGGSGEPSISADGRFVAFATGADNLGGPQGPFSDVYVYDRKRDRVELVSRRSRAAGGEGANSDSSRPAISADGRYVAFETTADNLGGPNAGVAAQVYVYDRRRDRVELVSRRSASAGGNGGDETSLGPSISADGRYVAFETSATNLGGPIDEGAGSNVYVYDRERDRVELVSRRSGGGVGGDDISYTPSISSDGGVVAFTSNAENLGGPIQSDVNVYVYDRARDRVQLVSRRSRSRGGQGADDFSDFASVSRAGRFVAFRTRARNLGGLGGAGIGGGEPPRRARIYVYDRERKRVQLASRQNPAAGAAPADDESDNPAISRSGSVIAFDTLADNLGGPVDPDVRNVYVRRAKR